MKPCEKAKSSMSNTLSASATFAMEVCGETFKIRSGYLNCGFQKALYLLKYKLYDKAPCIRKVKIKFEYIFSNSKSKYRVSRKGNQKLPQKLFHNHYCLDGNTGIVDWYFTLF